jgi:hypothetical protein
MLPLTSIILQGQIFDENFPLRVSQLCFDILLSGASDKKWVGVPAVAILTVRPLYGNR